MYVHGDIVCFKCLRDNDRNVGRGLAPAETLFQTTDKVVWVNFFFRFIFNVHISNVIILQRNIFKLKPHNNGGRKQPALHWAKPKPNKEIKN